MDINFNTNVNISWNSHIQDMCSNVQLGGPNLAQELSNVFALAGKFYEGMSNFVEMLQSRPASSCQCGCVAPPNVQDSGHPPGALRKEGDTLITPGGYKVEQLNQFEWQITGPDGKNTRIWGDPHVAEGDGGKWDFKRDSAFTLPDGTRINVTTKPWGNDMTVTGELEVICGNDRCVVSDIDKGKGKVGDITHDGILRTLTDKTQRDVFQMGPETDDWTLGGHEIVGSEQGGDVIKVGQQMQPAIDKMNAFGGPAQWGRAIGQAIGQALLGMLQPHNPIADMLGGGFGGHGISNDFHDPKNLDLLGKACDSLANVFQSLSELVDMSSQLDARRHLMF